MKSSRDSNASPSTFTSEQLTRLPSSGEAKHQGGSTGRRVLRKHGWAMLAVLVVLAGTIGSAVAATGLARSAAQRSQRSFVFSSEQISTTLKLAIQSEEDLVVDTEAFVLGKPDASETDFVAWASAVRAMARYPELQGVGEAVVVPAAQLAAYAAGATAAAKNGPQPAQPFVVTPPGRRPFYCFSTIGVARHLSENIAPGRDLCAGKTGQTFLATLASGQPHLEPLTIGGVRTLSIGVPIYPGGVVPPTVAARKDTFVGWVGVSLVPGVVLATALAGHPKMAVELRYDQAPSSTGFRGGAVPAGAQSLAINMHNGWTVETFAKVDSAALTGNPSALMLLIVGLGLSLLLGYLLYLLGTGRARAMVLVGERTDELQFQVMHDSLTKLPNRALILDRINLMLARARRSNLPTVAMFLDLDDFKDTNDTLGHHVGDQLLVAVASRLTAATREGDTVGRLGGDEFVVLIEGASLNTGVETAADRFLDVFAAPFKLAGSQVLLSVSASIGVASGDRSTADELLRDADVALYMAKAAGKGRAVVFAPEMQAAAQDRHLLAADLRDALEVGQFFLQYQPTISLQTNAVTGVEALLRWRHPVRGVVQPNDFIPALEASGLIVPVGAWVVAEACRQGAVWLARGHRFTVSVNVSAKQVELDRVVDDVERALFLSGFDPKMLVLELTETTLMQDVPDTIARLGQLKALGLRLAVDDFGTGYSSLAYLRKFPIDILKIDRSFISAMGDSVESAALVHTLVQLGKVLKLETIAEGIEEDDQRSRLQAENVDTGQGFLFSRPLDVAAVDRFLADSAHSAGPVPGGVPVLGRLPVPAASSRR